MKFLIFSLITLTGFSAFSSDEVTANDQPAIQTRLADGTCSASVVEVFIVNQGLLSIKTKALVLSLNNKSDESAKELLELSKITQASLCRLAAMYTAERCQVKVSTEGVGIDMSVIQNNCALIKR